MKIKILLNENLIINVKIELILKDFCIRLSKEIKVNCGETKQKIII